MKSLRSIVLGLSLATLVGCVFGPKYPERYTSKYPEPSTFEFTGKITEENYFFTDLGSFYIATIVDENGNKELVSRFFADPKGAERLDNELDIDDIVTARIDRYAPEYKGHKFAYSIKNKSTSK